MDCATYPDPIYPAIRPAFAGEESEGKFGQDLGKNEDTAVTGSLSSSSELNQPNELVIKEHTDRMLKVDVSRLETQIVMTADGLSARPLSTTLTEGNLSNSLRLGAQSSPVEQTNALTPNSVVSEIKSPISSKAAEPETNADPTGTLMAERTSLSDMSPLTNKTSLSNVPNAISDIVAPLEETAVSPCETDCHSFSNLCRSSSPAAVDLEPPVINGASYNKPLSEVDPCGQNIILQSLAAVFSTNEPDSERCSVATGDVSAKETVDAAKCINGGCPDLSGESALEEPPIMSLPTTSHGSLVPLDSELANHGGKVDSFGSSGNLSPSHSSSSGTSSAMVCPPVLDSCDSSAAPSGKNVMSGSTTVQTVFSASPDLEAQPASPTTLAQQTASGSAILHANPTSSCPLERAFVGGNASALHVDSQANSPCLPPSSPPSSQVSDLQLSQAPVIPYKRDGRFSQLSSPSVANPEETPEPVPGNHNLPSSQLTSSSPPFPSSSPQRIFTSSPTSATSPPTSPPLLSVDEAKLVEVPQIQREDAGVLSMSDARGGAASTLGKRIRSPPRRLSSSPAQENAASPKSSPDDRGDKAVYKRSKQEAKVSPSRAVTPRRVTQASLKRQDRKLKMPFRSPLMTNDGIAAGKRGVYAAAVTSDRLNKRADPGQDGGHSSEIMRKGKMIAAPDSPVFSPTKDYTPRAAKPFKPPVPAAAFPASSSSSAFPSEIFSGAKAAMKIRELEAEVRKVKQAIKVKEDKEEEKLEALLKKWRTVGREVAWEVWNTVKDLVPEGSNVAKSSGSWDDYGPPCNQLLAGKKRAPDDGWGWDNGREGKRAKHESFENPWGWNGQGNGAETEGDRDAVEASDHEGREDEPRQHTLGTMLRYMQIDPVTLGWDEDEGDFVGDP